MILLTRGYRGYAAGTIVQLPTQVEAALVAQNIAAVSAGPVTAGAVTTDLTSGRLGAAAAAASVVLTNPNIDKNSKIAAYLSNAAADATATSFRITCADAIAGAAGGTATFTFNAATTGIVAIDWALMTLSGELPPN